MSAQDRLSPSDSKTLQYDPQSGPTSPTLSLDYNDHLPLSRYPCVPEEEMLQFYLTWEHIK